MSIINIMGNCLCSGFVVFVRWAFGSGDHEGEGRSTVRHYGAVQRQREEQEEIRPLLGDRESTQEQEKEEDLQVDLESALWQSHRPAAEISAGLVLGMM